MPGGVSVGGVHVALVVDIECTYMPSQSRISRNTQHNPQSIGGKMEEETKEEARGAGEAVWSCAQCSVVHEEPSAEAIQKLGGIVSCTVCLAVRGQGLSPHNL
jgi:Zn-finger protein